MRWWLMVVVVLMAVGGTTASAQQETPEPGPNAVKLLPKADLLGEGWMQTEVRGVDAAVDLFDEAAVASYGGPEGARAVVYSYLVTDSRAAVRQSWEATSRVFDNYRARLGYDYARDEQLAQIAAPEGCTEAKRSEGEHDAFFAPAAVTMCAADPDRIVIAVVMGGIDGVTDYTASDWLAGSAITGKPLQRPGTR